MGKIHNKLVRDKIPEIIEANGETPVAHKLDDQEYFEALVVKLQEECDEFKDARNIEELADIQEVLLALADILASRQELEQVRLEKMAKRGGFKDRIYLERTE